MSYAHDVVVYVGAEVGSSTTDWFAVFSRNAGDGTLTFVEGHFDADYHDDIVFGFCGGVGPSESAVAVSPDGKKVFFSHPVWGALALFSRDETTGRLSLTASICDDLLIMGDDDIGAIISLAVSHKGDHLYSAGGASSTLGAIDYTPQHPGILFYWSVIQGAVIE